MDATMKQPAVKADSSAAGTAKAVAAIMATPAPEMAEIRHWVIRRRDAFHKMAAIFPQELEKDYGARVRELKLFPPEGVDLGNYKEYVERSIGIACVFFYREDWKEKADSIIALIDWNRARANVETMAGDRGKFIKKNLTIPYLTAVAVLSDAVGQLTGVDSSLLLGIMTRETGMDHNNYNPATKDRGICQLNRNNPLFTYVALRGRKDEARLELKDTMRLVLPEKSEIERAEQLMAGLFDAVDVKGGKQGDLAMNIIGGALTYRYKYCANTGKAALMFRPGEEPERIGFHRKSVEDYNGTDAKKEYAAAVQKYSKRYGTAAMAAVPVKLKEIALGEQH